MYEQQWSTIYKNKLWPLQHLGFIFSWELHNERLFKVPWRYSAFGCDENQ